MDRGCRGRRRRRSTAELRRDDAAWRRGRRERTRRARAGRSDGRAFAHQLTRQGVFHQVILVSGAPDTVHRAREIGAAGYLAKPFDSDDLLVPLRRLGLLASPQGSPA